MKTPEENKAIDYKARKESLLKAGWEPVPGVSITSGRAWNRQGILGPLTMDQALLAQGTKGAVSAKKPEPEKKTSKKKDD